MGRRTSGIVGKLDVCPHCERTDVNVITEEVGIGFYEFWGQKGNDSRWGYFCEECGEEVNYDEE